MAKNVLGTFAFLRNGKLYKSKEEAIEGLKKGAETSNQDGTLVLARYVDGTKVKTLLGVIYIGDKTKTITLFNGDETITWGNKESNGLFYEDIYKNYDELKNICVICDSLSV